MVDPHAFALDVLRLVCERLAARADDLRLMAETASSFEEWVTWEAFLACKGRDADYPFCEVAAKPTYGSEGVVGDDGRLDPSAGDLRVGGPDDGANHCWLFAEFAVLHDGNRAGPKWWRKVEDDAAKLRRLGWKRSAAVLVVVAISRGDVLTDWAGDLAASPVWNQPALADPFALALLGGGSLVVKAFDIKQDPAHTLTAATQAG